MKSWPVPLSAMLCGLPAALSVSVTAATRAPPAVGLKVTVIVQFALAASDDPQVFVSMKSPALVPLKTMLVIVSAAPSLFVTVTICEALDALATVAANVSVFAEASQSAAPGPFPLAQSSADFPERRRQSRAQLTATRKRSE
jgi:hypothetical protein